MPRYTGILTIISNQSSLNSNLILMAGIPDGAQAIFAATQFLIKTKHLFSGQFIEVIGSRKTIGSVQIIVMTDANAVSPESAANSLSHFNAALNPALTKTPSAKPKKNVRKQKGKG